MKSASLHEGRSPSGTKDGNRRADGFTLLEVLVALAVLGVLLAGLVQGIAFGLRAWEAETRIAARRSDLDAIDRTLRYLIRHMDPGSETSPRGVQGTADRLAMTTELPVAAGAMHNRRVDAVLLVNDRHQLILRWVPHIHATWFARRPPPFETVLLAGVQLVAFAYWQTSPPPGRWAAAWAERRPPALVRVRLVFPAGDQRQWPDVVAAPVLDRLDR